MYYTSIPNHRSTLPIGQLIQTVNFAVQSIYPNGRFMISQLVQMVHFLIGQVVNMVSFSIGQLIQMVQLHGRSTCPNGPLFRSANLSAWSSFRSVNLSKRSSFMVGQLFQMVHFSDRSTCPHGLVSRSVKLSKMVHFKVNKMLEISEKVSKKIPKLEKILTCYNKYVSVIIK